MLKKDDPTKQLVYYQVISLGLTLTLPIRSRAHILLPGRTGYLHERCDQDADYREHFQVTGPDGCVEPR